MTLKILIGQRFNNLTVLLEGQKGTNGRVFKVQCDCGKTSQVLLSNLTSGHTKSCGCLSAKVASEKATTHGMTNTKEYKSWQDMLNRCTNPTGEYYHKYSKLIGGIELDFLTSFELFLGEVGYQPSGGGRWSIGRIDNDVGYIRGNLRWETGYQQNRNRSKFTSNTSGITGVQWIEKGSRPYGRARARWYELDGKLLSKSFSEKDIGKDEAMILAADYRKLMIQGLRENGAEYSDKHGEEFMWGDKICTKTLLDKLKIEY